MIGSDQLKKLGCAGAVLGGFITIWGLSYVSHGSAHHPYLVLWPGLFLTAAAWVTHALGTRPPRSAGEWAKLLVTAAAILVLGYMLGRWCYYYPE